MILASLAEARASLESRLFVRDLTYDDLVPGDGERGRAVDGPRPA